MDGFNFISQYITAFFRNNGLNQYYIFIFGAFGVAILYKILMGIFRQKL